MSALNALSRLVVTGKFSKISFTADLVPLEINTPPVNPVYFPNSKDPLKFGIHACAGAGSIFHPPAGITGFTTVPPGGGPEMAPADIGLLEK